MREELLQLLAVITVSSARKKVYARKASAENRDDRSRLLLAVAESESVQARRLLSGLRGRIDRTEGYMATVFTEEIRGVINAYQALLNKVDPQQEKATAMALSQLAEAERQTLRFRSAGEGEGASPMPSVYYVCQFCGYIAAERKPDNCPVCKAKCSGFSRPDSLR